MRKLVIILVALLAVFAFIGAYSGASKESSQKDQAAISAPFSFE